MSGQATYDLVLHQDADPTTSGVAICGFSTVGMVGVIAASHVISQLKLNQLGTVLNPDFPAMALVHHEVPKHPVRVYQGMEWRIHCRSKVWARARCSFCKHCSRLVH